MRETFRSEKFASHFIGAVVHGGLKKAVTTLAVAAMFALAAGTACRATAPADGPPLKIGIIGAGHIGGTLARLWTQAGYEVMISSRHPDELRALARTLGAKASVGTPHEAAVFGDVVLISIPYHALPQIGRDLGHDLAGKIVLDTGNPYPKRDGAMAVEARKKGTGIASAEFLPGVRLVRAFNEISYVNLGKLPHRQPDLVGIPLAGDDPQALAVAQRLVRDAGFEPVVVGPLARARDFDVGTRVYTEVLTAAELRAQLGLPAPASASDPSP
jgi:predicted dinucleotide-binding enzyme